ncbi:hypothetical protein Tco_0530337 [Tanacetum coccineum]
MASKRATRVHHQYRKYYHTTAPNAQLHGSSLLDQGVTSCTGRHEMQNRNGYDSRYFRNGLLLRSFPPAMPMKTLKKMMTDKYCPRGEIKKIEFEMWNLKVKDMIHGSVMATKPKTMQDAIEFATELMEKKISTFAERQAENKRKLDNNNFPRGRMWFKLTPLGLVKGKSMLELYHCATSASFITMAHALSDCPKLKNGNQARGTETRGRVLALAGGETNQDLDDKEDNTNA